MTLSLPAKPSEVGAVCRLLLAEAYGPAYASYNESASLQCMQWMKVVLVNRLANNPKQFRASGAKNLIDIIKAPGQFKGFSGYPNYAQEIVHRLQQAIDIANNAKDKRSPTYQLFIQNAINIANSPAVADPCNTGLYGWRTANSGSPGSGFITFRVLAGVTFFTLSDATSK